MVALGSFGVAFKEKGDGMPVGDTKIEPMPEQTNPRAPKKIEWPPAALDPSKEPKKAKEIGRME